MFARGNLLSIVLLGAFLALSGCATDKKMASADDFMELLGQSSTKVDALLDKGNQEEAVRVLDDLAKKNPDRKEPFARKAKIYFDAGNYAQAIVAAEEVLQRDSTDRSAKSIRAVAGLRVAAQSLADLRNDVELKGNARSDAASLAKVMRETLGEEVLVPPGELEAKKKREAAAVAAAKARAKAEAKVEAKKKEGSASEPAPRAAASGGDPFGSLK